MVIPHFQLLADYNYWMNQRLYSVVVKLDEHILKRDMGAFFNSIFGTLNHNVAGDQLWLKRFINHTADFDALSVVAELPDIRSLDQILYETLPSLRQAREQLDSVILNLCRELQIDDLQHNLVYQTTDGETVSRRFDLLLQHFFNHQTHHRGQLSTLLSQNDLDIGVTDLLVLIPEQPLATVE